MRQQLICHPDTPSKAVRAIEVDADQSDYGQLVARFVLHGDLTNVVVPRPVRYASRANDLWMTTCVEAFVQASDEAYAEFNLSPSTAWALYSFEAYRQGMASPPIDAPPIDIEQSDTALVLTAALDLGALPFLSGHDWKVGLSAVVEEIDGNKSYWALRHPPGKPDFHHPDCFALELPAR